MVQSGQSNLVRGAGAGEGAAFSSGDTAIPCGGTDAGTAIPCGGTGNGGFASMEAGTGTALSPITLNNIYVQICQLK